MVFSMLLYGFFDALIWFFRCNDMTFLSDPGVPGVCPSGGQICNQCKWRSLAGEITQVKESIPWVRCASGNVFLQILSIDANVFC